MVSDTCNTHIHCNSGTAHTVLDPWELPQGTMLIDKYLSDVECALLKYVWGRGQPGETLVLPELASSIFGNFTFYL